MSTVRPSGKVISATALSVRIELPGGRMGDLVEIRRRGAPLLGQVVGVSGAEAIVMPFGGLAGVGVEDPVEVRGNGLDTPIGSELLGRVLDGLGRPLDGRTLPGHLPRRPTDAEPPPALSRSPVTRPLETGVRAIDGLVPLGVGQRVGLFAGSGVGKSSLLGAVARGTNAEVVVVALVGERGREVAEFIDENLKAAREKSVVVVATSDAPALERLHAAYTATAIAESFRDAGLNVLLLVDSITRVARAQREVGLAAGEPPTRRGYPPSVFAMLPRLLERTGQSAAGAISAIYTVLVEGDDLDEPVTDEVRGILDGHLVLSRTLAERGHFPAVDVPASISRVARRISTPAHQQAAARVRRWIADYERQRDLIALGAYKRGSDPAVDEAIGAMPSIERWLRQDPEESDTLATSADAVERLARGGV